jgi:hypothetical protein
MAGIPQNPVTERSLFRPEAVRHFIESQDAPVNLRLPHGGLLYLLLLVAFAAAGSSFLFSYHPAERSVQGVLITGDRDASFSEARLWVPRPVAGIAATPGQHLIISYIGVSQVVVVRGPSEMVDAEGKSGANKSLPPGTKNLISMPVSLGNDNPGVLRGQETPVMVHLPPERLIDLLRWAHN